MAQQKQEAKTLRIPFIRERETKNTVVYTEATEEAPMIGTLYVQKWAVKKLGSDGSLPAGLIVTITTPDA